MVAQYRMQRMTSVNGFADLTMWQSTRSSQHVCRQDQLTERRKLLRNQLDETVRCVEVQLRLFKMTQN